MDQDQHARDPKLAVWRLLQQRGALQCPVCRSSLHVADQQFHCSACASVYPVESGVPLLMRPAEITSVPEHVVSAFNIPPAWKEQVATALTPLTKYRIPSQPEFANFFARFDRGERQMPQTVLTVAATAAAIAEVQCLTECLPETLASEETEWRSIRLRNRSNQVLFTDERYPLYLSYKLFTSEGAPVRFESSRSALPCPLRPGGELTVPVKLALPPGLSGRLTVQFYFVLTGPAAGPVAAARGLRQRAGAMLATLRQRDRVHWFDAAALAEMHVTAVATKPPFAATQGGTTAEFDLEEDARRADAFLSEVLCGLRAAGMARLRVLEIGAGIHPISLRVVDADMTVIVSDISLVMQTLAAVLHSAVPAVLEGRAGFASFDMMYPPFGDGSFDVICICAALHHMALPDKFLQRLAPLLSPRGRFVALREPCLVDPSAPGYIAELAHGFNEQMFELSEWGAMIGRAGLAIDRAAIDFGCSLKFSARLA